MVVGCSLGGLTEETRLKALAAVEKLSEPATQALAEEWIATLHAATAHRSDDPAGLALSLDLYASALTAWPADVALAACLKLARRRQKPNWFPPLNELEQACEAIGSGRKHLLAALRDWRPPTAAEIRRQGLHDQARAAWTEVAAMERQLGFVGDISALSPERRAQLDAIRAKRAEARALEIELSEMGGRAHAA